MVRCSTSKHTSSQHMPKATCMRERIGIGCYAGMCFGVLWHIKIHATNWRVVQCATASLRDHIRSTYLVWPAPSMRERSGCYADMVCSLACYCTSENMRQTVMLCSVYVRAQDIFKRFLVRWWSLIVLRKHWSWLKITLKLSCTQGEAERLQGFRRDPLRDKIREVGRGLSLADTQTGPYGRLYSRRRLCARRGADARLLLLILLTIFSES